MRALACLLSLCFLNSGQPSDHCSLITRSSLFEQQAIAAPTTQVITPIIDPEAKIDADAGARRRFRGGYFAPDSPQIGSASAGIEAILRLGRSQRDIGLLAGLSKYTVNNIRRRWRGAKPRVYERLLASIREWLVRGPKYTLAHASDWLAAVFPEGGYYKRDSHEVYVLSQDIQVARQPHRNYGLGDIADRIGVSFSFIQRLARCETGVSFQIYHRTRYVLDHLPPVNPSKARKGRTRGSVRLNRNELSEFVGMLRVATAPTAEFQGQRRPLNLTAIARRSGLDVEGLRKILGGRGTTDVTRSKVVAAIVAIRLESGTAGAPGPQLLLDYAHPWLIARLGAEVSPETQRHFQTQARRALENDPDPVTALLQIAGMIRDLASTDPSRRADRRIEQEPADPQWDAVLKKVGGYLWSLLPDHAADQHNEILHDVYLACRKTMDEGLVGNLEAYAMGTARIRVVKILEQRKIDRTHEDITDLSGMEVRSREDILAAAQRKEHLEILHQAISTLKGKQNIAFNLVILGQTDLQEAARILGWTEPQVRLNAYRGRDRVIKVFKELQSKHQKKLKGAA